MLAVVPSGAADGDLLQEVSGPRPQVGEVLVTIRATALNRADLLQLRGLYPPPPGESEVPGLECAGEIIALGPEVEGWRIGDRVMALLAGGGHAEQVAVPTGQLMPIPEGWSFTDAAALPEVALTAWTNLVSEGGLSIRTEDLSSQDEGQSVLITAAASGVGTFAVQLARELGARVLVAGRKLDRLRRLEPLGAEACFELGGGLADEVKAATGGAGVDLVIDLAGGTGVANSLKALRSRGRLVLVGILAGPRAEIDLADVLRRRLRLIGSVLRARARAEKAELVAGFWGFAAQRLKDGRLQPVVDRVMPFTSIDDAYSQLAEGGVLGKIVLEVDHK